MGGLEAVLRKWSQAKAAAAFAEKEVEQCKTQVEAEMLKAGTDTLTTASFEVTKRKQSRESCKEGPAGRRVGAVRKDVAVHGFDAQGAQEVTAAAHLARGRRR